MQNQKTNKMTEQIIEWRKIEGFEIYSVSSAEEVRNDETGRILKPRINSKGYFMVWLSKNGGRKSLYVHRLVALSFIPNPACKKCVDHRDGDPLNNKLENLRWATVSENNTNVKMKSHNTSGVKGVCWHKPSSKWCVQIRINGVNKYLGLFETIEEATAVRRKAAQEHYGEFVHSSERL